MTIATSCRDRVHPWFPPLQLPDLDSTVHDSTVQRFNGFTNDSPNQPFRLPARVRSFMYFPRLMDVLPPIPSPIGPRWRRCWHGLSQIAIFSLVCVGAALAWKQMAHPT